MNRGDYIKAKDLIKMTDFGGNKDSIVKDEIVLIIEEPARDRFIVEHIQRRDVKQSITSRMDRYFLEDNFVVCDRPLTQDEEKYKSKLLKYLNKKHNQNECSLECDVNDIWCNGIKFILEEIINDVENDEFMELSHPTPSQ